MEKRSSVRRAVVARLHPVGTIRSKIKTLKGAPKQGSEGAPDAWLEVSAFAAPALDGLVAGDDVIVITWLHQARRNVMKVHPRSDLRRPRRAFSQLGLLTVRTLWACTGLPCGRSTANGY